MAYYAPFCAFEHYYIAQNQDVTRFAKRGLILAIVNIEKSRFEILIFVYLEPRMHGVYEILHQSIVI